MKVIDCFNEVVELNLDEVDMKETYECQSNLWNGGFDNPLETFTVIVPKGFWLPNGKGDESKEVVFAKCTLEEFNNMIEKERENA